MAVEQLDVAGRVSQQQFDRLRLIEGLVTFVALLLIVVVMGGIYTGIFTPTEAAAMSAVYAFICAVFIYRDLGIKDVPKVLLNSANMSAMLLYIITNAVLFSFIMTNENIPQALADWMMGHGLGVIAFLLMSTCCCCWPATSWNHPPSC